MSERLHVLLIEDSASDAGLVARQIEHAGYDLIWERVEDAATLRAALERRVWDVVLCDYTMPGFNGLDALAVVRATLRYVPFIFVSGTMGEEKAVEALQAGAQDYVVKGRLSRLVPAIERELREIQANQQREQAEQAMRESEHKYRQLFESLSEAAFLFDLGTRRIIDTNIQAEALLGLARWEIIGQPLGSTPQTASLGKVLDQFAENAGAKAASSYDAEIPDAAKSPAAVQVSLTALTLYGRQLMLALVRDVTERKALEAQLRQSQKMEAIGRLAGGVAHDFNNLLAVIRGNAELVLTNKEKLDRENDGYLKQVIAAAERAAGLTRQLLLFSRKQVPQPQLLDLNNVVRDLAQMLCRIIGEDVSLNWDYAETLPLINADAGMVEQVLLNLVVNARDAMPQGGSLVVRTSHELIEAAYTETNPQARIGSHICLSVTDTGRGIPPEIIARIFEPFFTTKDVGKGTGLGLATVYGILQQHHGWISVTSAVGKGSVFRVYFPAAEGRLAAVSPTSETALKGGTETILLVEDESSVRFLMRKTLERYGYTVFEAGSGVEALAVWREHRDRIDLFLTDMIMPDGMTGRELAANLHVEKPTLAVIFASGYSADVAGKALELQPGVNFLQKPFSIQSLVRIVRDCLDRERKRPIDA